jgi:hypothetical protein
MIKSTQNAAVKSSPKKQHRNASFASNNRRNSLKESRNQQELPEQPSIQSLPPVSQEPVACAAVNSAQADLCRHLYQKGFLNGYY